MNPRLYLYTFHRSTAAYRVRIALNYKELPQRICQHCSTLDYFEKAKPENQFDYTPDPLPAGVLPRNTK